MSSAAVTPTKSALAKKKKKGKNGSSHARMHNSSVSFFDDSFAVTEIPPVNSRPTVTIVPPSTTGVPKQPVPLSPRRPSPPKPRAPSSPNQPSQQTAGQPTQASQAQAAVQSPALKRPPTPKKALPRIPRKQNNPTVINVKESPGPAPAKAPPLNNSSHSKDLNSSPPRSPSPSQRRQTKSPNSSLSNRLNHTDSGVSNHSQSTRGSVATQRSHNIAKLKQQNNNSSSAVDVDDPQFTAPAAAPAPPPPLLAPIASGGSSTGESKDGFLDNLMEKSDDSSDDEDPYIDDTPKRRTSSISDDVGDANTADMSHGTAKQSKRTTEAAQGLVNKIQLILHDKEGNEDSLMGSSGSTIGDTTGDDETSTFVTNSVGTNSITKRGMGGGGMSGAMSVLTDDEMMDDDTLNNHDSLQSLNDSGTKNDMIVDRAPLDPAPSQLRSVDPPAPQQRSNSISKSQLQKSQLHSSQRSQGSVVIDVDEVSAARESSKTDNDFAAIDVDSISAADTLNDDRFDYQINNDSQSSHRHSLHDDEDDSHHNGSGPVMLVSSTHPLNQVEEGDETENSAQERALAIASRHHKRNSYNGTNSNNSIDDNASVGSKSLASLHRSRAQYGDAEFIHPSVIEAAKLEKQKALSNEGSHDDLMTLAFGTEAKTKWETCWANMGGAILCLLILAFWGGFIPYLIVRYDQNPNPPTMTPVLTHPPAAAPVSSMIPWTPAPTSTPEPPEPTAPPTTTAQANEGLLELLDGTPAPASKPTTSIPTADPTLAPSMTTMPPVVNSTAPTLSPTEDVNGTTIVIIPLDPVEEDNNTTIVIIPVNDTDAPTATPTTGPATFTPFTNIPTTASPTTASPTEPPSTPSPTIEEPEVVFPEYTLSAFANPGSAQSKAFSWMLRDPNFGDYTPGRVRQRFALAVLYFATNGDDWWTGNYTSDQSLDSRGGFLPWLSYAGHECDWYHQRTSDDTSSSSRANVALLQLYSSNQNGVVVCDNEFHVNGVFRGFRTLYLEKVGLQGTLPLELAMLTGLQELHISHNQDLGGTMPREWFWDDKVTTLSWQTSMREIELRSNRITGIIPTEIGLATNMEILDLQQNSFRRTIPSEIGLLTSLQELLWNENILSGTIPTEIGLATNMEILDLQQNAFRGTIPSEIGLMTSLQDLLWNDNTLTGTIPTELGLMTNALKAVSWNNNQLSGTIPDEVIGLQALQEFYVGNNRLSGSIPWHFGVLRDTLVDLHLYSNRFVGDIPTRLGLLTKLRWFHAGDNQLTGTLPTELGQMTMLQLFQVENNALEGRLPSETLAAWEIASRVWLQGNPELNGTIPVTWCERASDGDVELANGTILALDTNSPNPGHSVDIRFDCASDITCSCAVGCSCE